MWILIVSLLVLGVVAAIAGLVRNRKLRRQLERGEINALPEVKVLTDCGADACEADERDDENCDQQEGECNLECLVPNTNLKPDYYDDEDLDQLAGIEPEQYTDEQEEMFSEIFYTMKPTDVPGWVHSLQLRNVSLPNGLKDEVWMVLREQRERKKSSKHV